jgi:DNA-binding transcriptional regulator LsrR (DeoR family)
MTQTTGPSSFLSVSTEQLRLFTKIAVLYHEEGMSQGEISQR